MKPDVTFLQRITTTSIYTQQNLAGERPFSSTQITISKSWHVLKTKLQKGNLFSESPHLTLFKLMLDQKGALQEKAHNHTCCRSLPLEMLQVEVMVQDQGQD